MKQPARPHKPSKEFTAWAEAQFVAITRRMIERSQSGEVSRALIQAECAQRLDVSPATVGRYILKYCADRGPFRRVGKLGKRIVLNPQYINRRQG